MPWRETLSFQPCATFFSSLGLREGCPFVLEWFRRLLRVHVLMSETAPRVIAYPFSSSRRFRRASLGKQIVLRKCMDVPRLWLCLMKIRLVMQKLLLFWCEMLDMKRPGVKYSSHVEYRIMWRTWSLMSLLFTAELFTHCRDMSWHQSRIFLHLLHNYAENAHNGLEVANASIVRLLCRSQDNV